MLGNSHLLVASDGWGQCLEATHPEVQSAVQVIPRMGLSRDCISEWYFHFGLLLLQGSILDTTFAPILLSQRKNLENVPRTPTSFVQTGTFLFDVQRSCLQKDLTHAKL